MTRIWVTSGTPTMPGIVNPLAAACEREYIPDQVHVLSNPGVADAVSRACKKLSGLLDAYESDATIETYDLASETEFADIITFYRSTIEAAHENDDEIAVDFTPGRKFISAIAFQAGFRYGADHVFYFHRQAGGYYGQYYPEIPRTATELIDFTEVLK